MPLYDMLCEDCGHEEKDMLLTREEEVECKECGKKMYRQLALAGFQLKGSGWYRDGYSNKGGGK